MNSKERVMCAVYLEVPDRIPMDFNANDGTLQRLYRDLNTNSHMELLKKLNIDILDIRGVVDPVYRGPVPKISYLADGAKQNFWGMQTRVMDTATGHEECYCDFILKDIDSTEDMEKHLWPKSDWFDFSNMEEMLKPWKDFCIMASGASIFQHPTFLRGFEDLLVDMMCNEEIADYLMDKFTNFYIDFHAYLLC